jgi:hypothetical protein
VAAMPQRNNLNGAGLDARPLPSGLAGLSFGHNDFEVALAEIQRLKQELAQTRSQLHRLKHATSDFVRLML